MTTLRQSPTLFRRRPVPRRVAQRGLTLIGLMAWAVLVGFAGYLVVRIVPTITEFYSIHGLVQRLADAPAPTVAEIRRAFDRQLEVDPTISAIKGSDLDITKENDRVVIRFAYEKEVELVQPVYLLIKYGGRTK